MSKNTLTTTEIGKCIGLHLSHTFITEKLRVPHREQVRNSFLWASDDLATIKDRLREYVEKIPITERIR
jgi:hypothetical protein